MTNFLHVLNKAHRFKPAASARSVDVNPLSWLKIAFVDYIFICNLMVGVSNVLLQSDEQRQEEFLAAWQPVTFHKNGKQKP